MKFRRLICALAALVTVAAQGSAQEITVVGPTDPRLGLTWLEAEGSWRGVWIPVRAQVADGSYEATFTLNPRGDQVHANLTINIEGSRVTVTRIERRGRCSYSGFLTTDGRAVLGTFVCAWAPRRMPWTATFGAQTPAPDQLTSADESNPLFQFTWLEREAALSAVWIPHTPRNLDGLYEGRWSQPGGPVTINQLAIRIQGDEVIVRRTRPQGPCDYHGILMPGRHTVSGTFTCHSGRGQLPWSAEIQWEP